MAESYPSDTAMRAHLADLYASRGIGDHATDVFYDAVTSLLDAAEERERAQRQLITTVQIRQIIWKAVR